MQLPRVTMVLLTSCCLAAAAQGSAAKVHFIRASGEATVHAKPDRVQISIGVVTQAPTAQAASAQNATQTSAVLDAVKRGLGSSGEIKTSGYSISPQYQYTNGRPPKITGYQASNTVLTTVNDLSLTGKVIDAANEAGANDITGISFSLRDDNAIRAQALAEAALKARSAAEAIAKALNVHIVAVLEADTTEAPIVRPMNKAFAMMAEGAPPPRAPTPIEPGDLDVRASVTVSFEVQ
jgi:uncharacterized protein YggE